MTYIHIADGFINDIAVIASNIADGVQAVAIRTYSLPTSISSRGMVLDSDSNLHIVSSFPLNITVISPNTADGATASALRTYNLPTDIMGPTALGIDGDGNIHVVDTVEENVTVISPNTLDGATAVAIRTYDLPTNIIGSSGLGIDSDGNFHISDINSRSIAVFAPNTADGATASALRTYNLPTDITSPKGLTIDGDGNIHVADNTGDEIVVIAPDTANGATAVAIRTYDLPTGFTSPEGLAFVPAPDDVVMPTTPAVFTITPEFLMIVAGETAEIELTSDVSVDGLTVADISVSLGTLGILTGSGTSFRIPLTVPDAGSGEITITIRVDAVTQGNVETTATVDYAESKDRVFLFDSNNSNFQSHLFDGTAESTENIDTGVTTIQGAAADDTHIYAHNNFTGVLRWNVVGARDTAGDFQVNSSTDIYKGLAVTDTHIVLLNFTLRQLEYYDKSAGADYGTYDSTLTVSVGTTGSFTGLCRGGNNLFVGNNQNDEISILTLAGAADSTFTASTSIIQGLFVIDDRLYVCNRNGTAEAYDLTGNAESSDDIAFSAGSYFACFVTFAPMILSDAAIATISSVDVFYAGQSGDVNFVFDQDVTGFILFDIMVVGAVVDSLTANSASSYTLTILPDAGAGSIVVSIAEGVVSPGNLVASATFTRFAVPTVVISTTNTSIDEGEVFNVSFVFSEVVTGFTEGDIDVIGGTRGALMGSGANYSLSVTAGVGAGTITVLLAHNVVLPGNVAVFVTFPRLALPVTPTVVISTTNTSIDESEVFNVSFVFSAVVTGFTAGDISVNGGTRGALTGSGANYSLSVTAGVGAGNIIVSIASDVVSPGNVAASETFPRLALPLVATTVVHIFGNNQIDNVSMTLSTPFNVEVRDQNGDVLSGITVVFAATAGGGTLSESSVITDSSGQAESTLTLGSTVGTNTVTATVTGITTPVTFTATATATGTGVASYIHITDPSDDNIRMILSPSSGGAASIIRTYTVSGLNSPIGMAFDGTHIHLVDIDDDNIRMILPPTAGGEASVVFTYTVSGLNNAGGMTFDGTHIHLVDLNDNNVRMILPPSSDGQASIVRTYTVDELRDPGGMAFDGTHIHLADFNDDNIRMILPPTAGGEASVVHTYTVFSLNDPRGITFDGTYIHLADIFDRNFRMIAPPSSSGQASIVRTYTVSGLGNPAGMTFDGGLITQAVLTLITTDTDIRAGEAVDISIASDIDISDFVASDVTVIGGTRGALTGSGTSWTLAVTAGSAGTMTVSIAEDSVTPGNVLASENFTINARAASAITFDDPSGESGGFTGVNIFFGESVTGLTLADLSASSGTLSNLTGSGTSWEADLDFPATGSGTVTVSLAEDSTIPQNANFASAIDYAEPAVALSFGSSTIANQSWIVGTAITSLTLPEATGGEGTIVYSLSPTLPTGVPFVASTRVLSGNPTAVFTSDTFTYTAEDTDGTTVELTFTIVVAGAAVPLALGWTVPTSPVGNTFSVTLTSNHPLEGVELDDFRFRIEDNSDSIIALTATNTTLAEVSGTNNWQLDIEVTGTLDADYTMRLRRETVQYDGQDYPPVFLVSDAFAIDSSIDDVAAIATISSTHVFYGGQSGNIDFVFDQDVTGFVLSDITVTGGTANSLTANSATSYTLNITANVGAGNIGISIAENVVSPGNVAASETFTRLVLPTVIISTTNTSIDEGEVFNVSFVFSAVVTGFSAGDITVIGGTRGALTGSGANYSLSVTAGAGAGTITVAIAQDVVSPGNVAASETFTRLALPVTPTVVISTTNTSIDESEVFNVSFVFSAVVTGFTAGDISVNGGTRGALTGSGANYSLSVTAGAGAGTITVAIAQDVVSPGNVAASVTFIRFALSAMPTTGVGEIHIADNTGNEIGVIAADTADGQDAVGLRTYDLPETITSPHAALLDGDGNLHIADTSGDEVAVIPTDTADGAMAVAIRIYLLPTIITSPRGMVLDGDGNIHVADTSGDEVAVISPNTADGDRAVVIRNYDLPTGTAIPSGLTIDADGNIHVSDSGDDNIRVYDPNVADGQRAVAIRTYDLPVNLGNPEGLTTDGDGNIHVVDISDDNVAVIAPDTADGQRAVALRTYGMPTGITAPQGLAFVPGSDDTVDTDPLSFGGESIGNQLWTVGIGASITLPEATGGTGGITYSLSPTLPTGKTFTSLTRVLDGSPTGVFSLETFIYRATDADGTVVELTFTAIVTAVVVPLVLGWNVSTSPVGNTFAVILTSNHPITGVELDDFRFRIADDSEGRIDLTAANTTLLAVAGTNNWRLDITLTGTYDADYTIRLRNDSLQYDGDNYPPTFLVSDTFGIDSSLDIVAAIATISSTHVFYGGQSGNIDFVFDQDVTGFVLSDITVIGGTANSLTANSATSYTLNITANAGAGNIGISIAENVVSPGNVAASETFTRLVLPTVIISTTNTSIDEGEVFNVSFVFSAVVTGFSAGDITVIGGTRGALTGSGANYSLSVTAGAGAGTITVAIAQDVVSPGNVAASETFTRLALPVTPTVVISTTNTSIDESEVFNVSFVFSAVVTGFTAGDISVNGGTRGALTGSGANYSLSVTAGVGAGNIIVSIASDVVSPGNVAASVTFLRLGLPVIPTVSISTTNISIDEDEVFNISIVFSAVVTGFTASDISVTGGVRGVLTGSGTTYTLSVTAGSGAGMITVAIAQNVVSPGNVAASEDFPRLTLPVSTGDIVNQISIVDATGDEIGVIAPDTVDGVRASAIRIYDLPTGIESPHGITLDGDGNFHVVDRDNDQIVVIAPDTADGATAVALRTYDLPLDILLPSGLTTDSVGNIHISDYAVNNVAVISPNIVDGQRAFALRTYLLPTIIASVQGLVIAGDGNIHVIDTVGDDVAVIPSDTADGQRAVALRTYLLPTGIASPRGITVDNNGNLHVSDTSGDEVAVFPPDTADGQQAVALRTYLLPVEITNPTGLVYIPALDNVSISSSETFYEGFAGDISIDFPFDVTGFVLSDIMVIGATANLLSVNSGSSYTLNVIVDAGVDTITVTILQNVVSPSNQQASRSFVVTSIINPAVNLVFMERLLYLMLFSLFQLLD